MSFISGFLGLCSAVGTGTAIEFATPGYSRQPIQFARPINGFARNMIPWSFGGGFGGMTAGRAIYDAASGGNLLLVLPHYTSRLAPSDSGDVGEIVLLLTALAPYPDGDAYSGVLAAGSVAGSTYDAGELIGVYSSLGGAPPGASVITLPGPQYRFVWSSPVSVGPGALLVSRGLLQLQSTARAVA